jgi:serine/threonine protein kinase
VLFAELFLKKTLFPGDCERKQLELILAMCGTPEMDKYKNFKDLSKNLQEKFVKYPKRRKFVEKIKEKMDGEISEKLIDLLDRMLKMDPSERITAEEAYNHPFFEEDPKPCKPEELPLICRDAHEYSVKQEIRTKGLSVLHSKQKQEELEKFKIEHENKFLYRKIPEKGLSIENTQKRQEERRPKSKPKRKIYTQPRKYEQKEKGYATNRDFIGGVSNVTKFNSMLGGSMISANNGINYEASISNAGGDLKRYMGTFYEDPSTRIGRVRDIPETATRHSFREYKMHRNENQGRRRKRYYEA